MEIVYLILISELEMEENVTTENKHSPSDSNITKQEEIPSPSEVQSDLLSFDCNLCGMTFAKR